MTEPTKAEIDNLTDFLNTIPGAKFDLSYSGDRKILADFIIHEGYRLAPPAKPAKRCIHGVLNPSDCFECYPKPAAGWPTVNDVHILINDFCNKNSLLYDGSRNLAKAIHAAFTKSLSDRGISCE